MKFVIFAIIGIISLATGVILFNFTDIDNVQVETLTGTPADNYPEIDREKYCGTSDAKSTKYVKEYLIPTNCTQPQAIVTSPDGMIWFAQSNTGKLAKFDPETELFTEYDNRFWPRGDNSMIWGLDYASDGTMWFTDVEHNSVWKFNTINNEYERAPVAFLDNSLPQRLEIVGSRIIINDFTGNQIVYLDNINSNDELVTYSLPTPAQNAVVAAFEIDSNNNLWFTNWIPDEEGSLVKINQTEFDLAIQNNTETVSFEFFSLPADLRTPNGISKDNSGGIWIADSSSSLFFKFDPISENFTKYTTSDPSALTYGNQTGQITSPASQPYWMKTSQSGNLVFNEQSANRIAIFNPSSETLVEYVIPSQNPNWGDCGTEKDCGVSQIFDFTIYDDKIWFTEWAENNIGYVDTSISLPVKIELDSTEISLKQGESKVIEFALTSDSKNKIPFLPLVSNPNIESGIDVKLALDENQYFVSLENPSKIEVTLHVNENATFGEYKILLGSSLQDISVSKFLTVKIE